MKLVDKEVNKWKKIDKIILLVNSIDISYKSSVSLNLNCNFENISRGRCNISIQRIVKKIPDTLYIHTDQPLMVVNIFYKIEGKILKIPGETSLRSDIQPRVYIPRAHLDSMFLLQRGSRVEHSRFIKFDQQAEIGQIKSELKTIFSNRNVDIDITTIDDRKRQIGRSLINLNRFLNLGGLIYLITSLLMTAYYVFLCFKLFRENKSKVSNIIARKIFVYSIFYLFVIFLLLLIESVFKLI